MKQFMTVAAMAFVTACAAQARVEAPTNDVAPSAVASHVSCEIRATRTGHGVRLEAIVRGASSLQGEYDFGVTARGAGGSSDILQGGPIVLRDGTDAIVGSAEISDLHYRAVLTLRDADGEICRLERRA